MLNQKEETLNQAKKIVNNIMSTYWHSRLYHLYNFYKGDGEIGQRISLEKAKIHQDNKTEIENADSISDLVESLMKLYMEAVKIRLAEVNRFKEGGHVFLDSYSIAITETRGSYDYGLYEEVVGHNYFCELT